MKRTAKRKSKHDGGLSGIISPATSGNRNLRVVVYAIIGLLLVYLLANQQEKSIVTKIGILLEALSLLFISPELFGIKDISKIQLYVQRITEQTAKSILNVFIKVNELKINKTNFPQIVSNVFYWMAWPMSKMYLSFNDKGKLSSYEWINSVEKSVPIALLNLLLLWTPGIALLLAAIPSPPAINPYLPHQVNVWEPEYPSSIYVSFFIIGVIFCYFALSHTLATITWHMNAIAVFLKKDRERRLLAFWGLLLFIFGSFLQFIAA